MAIFSTGFSAPRLKIARFLLLIATGILAIHGHLGFPSKSAADEYKLSVKILLGFGFGFLLVGVCIVTYILYHETKTKAPRIVAIIASILAGLLVFASVVVWRVGINIGKDKNFFKELMTFNSFRATSLMFAALMVITAVVFMIMDACKKEEKVPEPPAGKVVYTTKETVVTTFPADSDKPATEATPGDGPANGQPPVDEKKDDPSLVQPRPIHLSVR